MNQLRAGGSNCLDERARTPVHRTRCCAKKGIPTGKDAAAESVVLVRSNGFPDAFIADGGWKDVREKGDVRSEGKEYVVKDGDVLLFKFNV